MLIGLTYDLRDDYHGLGLTDEALAEFDSRETIEAIDRALGRLGHQVDWIGNVKALARRLVNGCRWDLVFNIAEGLSGRSREAQVPALLEAYSIPYTFSDPLTQALGLDKAMAKRIVRDAGLPTAPFAVLAGPQDDGACTLPYPVFLKPLGGRHGQGMRAGLEGHIADRLAERRTSPARPVRAAGAGRGVPARARVYRGHSGQRCGGPGDCGHGNRAA